MTCFSGIPLSNSEHPAALITRAPDKLIQQKILLKGMGEVFEKLKVTSSEFPVVLFNASGTLLQYQMSFERFYVESLESVGIKKSEFDVAVVLESVIRDLNDEIEKNSNFEWKPSSWVRRIVDKFNLPADIAQPLEATLRAQFQTRMTVAIATGTLDVCSDLKQRGYRLGIVSNWNGLLVDLLRDHAALDLFDSVITSYDVGLSKPDKRIFELAVSDMDETPDRVRFVGGSYAFDVMGSKRAGLSPVLYDPQMREMKALNMDLSNDHDLGQKVVSLETLRQHRRLHNIPVVLHFEDLLKIFL